MASFISQNIDQLTQEIARIADASIAPRGPVTLLAASKTRNEAEILQAYQAGITDFGENKVQEMVEKWPSLKQEHSELALHFIGQLQSNKAAEVVEYCDLLHTLDRIKLANAIDKEAQKHNKVMRCLIQVNAGEEEQKGGVLPQEFEALLHHCQSLKHISIEGLMCVPPADEPAAPHFALLQKMSKEHHLPYLSMGMSGDYQEAIRFGASAIRIGTGIFGARA